METGNLAAGLSAVAAVAAAVAAWLSWLTSRRALAFQRNLAKNQSVALDLHALLIKLQTIDGLLSNVGELSDDEFSRIESFFNEAQVSIRNFVFSSVLPEKGATNFSSWSFSEFISELDDDEPALTKEISRVQHALDSLYA